MLAALHYNENSRREQATTAAGVKRYVVMFPKHKKGEHTVKQVKEPCTYGKWNRLRTRLTYSNLSCITMMVTYGGKCYRTGCVDNYDLSYSCSS